MEPLEIVEKALTEVAAEFAAGGTYEGDLLAQAFRSVAAKIWIMNADQNSKVEE